MNKNSNNLPIYGVGPYYGISIILTTIISTIIFLFGYLNSGMITINWLKIIFYILGFISICIGLYIWAGAALVKKGIDYFVKRDELCTIGVYSICRNPCYSGIMLMCDGVIFLLTNYWLLFLPFLFYISLVILLKLSEEKWLKDKFGQDYINYCQKVNRVFPWFSKKI